jgi:hypothetical protein
MSSRDVGFALIVGAMLVAVFILWAFDVQSCTNAVRSVC